MQDLLAEGGRRRAHCVCLRRRGSVSTVALVFSDEHVLQGAVGEGGVGGTKNSADSSSSKNDSPSSVAHAVASLAPEQSLAAAKRGGVLVVLARAVVNLRYSGASSYEVVSHTIIYISAL
jgi:hypothetical protein